LAWAFWAWVVLCLAKEEDPEFTEEQDSLNQPCPLRSLSSPFHAFGHCPPGIIVAVMQDTSLSPLSSLTPSPAMRPLALPRQSISPVTLSQVEDILATSGMVQALHARINPPPPASSPLSPSLNMEVDLDKNPSTLSHATSLNPWIDSHPPLGLRVPTPEWASWIQVALSHGVPVKGLYDFIVMYGTHILGASGQRKWTWIKKKALCDLSSSILLL